MQNNLSRREREKAVHESEIIRAAEAIFSEKGFDNSSMDEIGKSSQFTKRTLYKYFINKEDLYFAVVQDGFEKLFTYFQDSIKTGENGYEKIRFSLLAYYRFYRDYPEKFRLMNSVGVIKSKAKDSPKYNKFLEFNDFIFTEIIKIIDEGKNDGSIRKEIDTKTFSYSIVFLITGFFREMSISGKTFTEHFSLDQETFSLFIINLLSSNLSFTDR
jgi:AcrR family transcriptional regulator